MAHSPSQLARLAVCLYQTVSYQYDYCEQNLAGKFNIKRVGNPPDISSFYSCLHSNYLYHIGLLKLFPLRFPPECCDSLLLLFPLLLLLVFFPRFLYSFLFPFPYSICLPPFPFLFLFSSLFLFPLYFVREFIKSTN